ncbi:MAG TPA: aldehyde dehydrogenase [Rhodobacteraceae bacterium]|jgi:aldehyde dehydrogenase (NAD(P)+)|nr:aldehyde dehydrogenase [Paracoccaceae bacterium]
MENPTIDTLINELDAAKHDWAKTGIGQRILILQGIKDSLIKVSDAWVKTAAQQKLIPAGSALKGEEWFSGPYALMTYCNAMITTLSGMQGKKYLNSIPLRLLENGQIAAKTVPHSIWDHLLLSGVKAEVWMQKGVNMANLAANTATAYDPSGQRQAKVALVLGAGNIAAIAPLDCLDKLFCQHQVVILKMNPVNEYLTEFLQIALKPLIDKNALRIVKGDAQLGEYLCNHPQIDEIHITGAGASHDAIVWGTGAQAVKNKKAARPVNRRRITSELGNVGPTIVVPGPWSKADLAFQAEHIASQKLHNSGFNCIACQMLILPKDWDKTEALMQNLKAVMAKTPPRQMYYPGAKGRMAEFASHSDTAQEFERGDAVACVVVPYEKGADDWYAENEVFAPAMSTYQIAENDPARYLQQAISFANQELHGTLGANIIIHPKTIKQIGKKQFEALIYELHYGCIGINAWSGLGFLLNQIPWGAFPGHTLDDVQSGIGFVHNTFMFDKAERSVITAPFRPFPRSLLSGELSLMPRPPWFVTNKKQHKIGKLLTELQHKPKWKKLPKIMFLALRG